MPTEPHENAFSDAPGSLDQQRRALSRVIRHDLRNPLTALAGYTDLAVRAGDLSPAQTRWLGRLRQLIDKLTDAADDLADLAWLDAGLPLGCVPFDLAAPVRRAVAACMDEAQAREIALVADLAANLTPVNGDPAWIEQALCALIENGLRYSAGCTTVTVRAWLEDRAAYCAVQDEGFGIPASDQPYVWDRFWRSPDPSVQAVMGGGFGLRLVGGVAQRHGGSVQLDSTPDQGTTVTLRVSPGEST